MRKTYFFIAVMSLVLWCFSSANAQQLNGLYTIDSAQATGGTNFQRFKDAIDSLTAKGVSGPVVFDVKTGTYIERVQINVIPGASPVNTITFDGGAGNAETRIITNNGVTGTRATVQINNSPYITLRNLTIQTTGTFGWGIHILGSGSNNCKVKSCIIDITGSGTTSTSTNYSGIVINGDATAIATGIRIDSLEIDSNIINYGAYGIVQVGAATSIAVNNKFRNNIINNANTYGVYLNYHANAEISGNTVTLRTGGTTSRGIYLQNSNSTGNNYTRITENKVFKSGQYGISIAASSNTGTEKGLLANNLIGGGFQHNTSYGIHITGSNRWNIYHNTVNKDRTGSSNVNQAALYIVSGDNITVYNNILAATAGSGLPLYVANATSIDSMDYNLFYKVNLPENLIYIGSLINSSNFAGVAGFNMNSFATQPYFTNDTDFHVNTGCNNGLYINGISSDIEGNTRSNPPDIGAYEYLAFNNIAIEELVQPVPGNVQAGLQDLVVRVKNVGTYPVSSFNVSYVLNNGVAVLEPWSGTLLPCDTVSVVFSGSKQMNLGNVNTLTVYTDHPNTVDDTDPGSDTLKTLLYTPLSGGYTIGHSGANYASFNEAVLALTEGGVSGPVVFDVQSGSYGEQVVIPPIRGASATNTITFQSAANNPDFVTLFYAGHVITLQGARYVSFKAITVTAVSSGNGFLLTDTASYDSITHCKINGQGGIGAGPTVGRKNVFSYNTISTAIEGRCIGLISTNPLSSFADSNVIANNTLISTGDGYALYLQFTPFLSVQNNIIDGRIMLYDLNNIFFTNNNIYYYQGNDNAINVQRGSGQRFYHNSVRTGFGLTYGVNSSRAISVLYQTIKDSNNQWKNNIFTALGTYGNPVGDVVNMGAAPSNVWDYNLYYNYTYGTNKPKLMSYYPDATGQDSHSLAYNPHFVSETDLRLTSNYSQVVALSDVTTDLEGNTRNNPTTFGAYEYSGINNIAVLEVVSPSFPVSSGLQDLIVKVKNVGTNAVTSFTVKYTVNNGVPDSFPWTGNLAPYDTATVIFTGANQINIIDSLIYSITVYTEEPNTITDANTADDTLNVTIASALAGIYTVNSTLPTDSDNFNSFTEALSALQTRGIRDSVTFDVAAGTSYTENPIVFQQIPGSNLYSIRFQKSGAGDNPIIYGVNGRSANYLSTLTFPDGVITLRGVSNMTFDGIDVADSISNFIPGSSTTFHLRIMEHGYLIVQADFGTIGSNNNTIKNCRIILNKNYTSSIGLFQYGGGNNASGTNNNNRYENIRIENSPIGIYLRGAANFPDSNNVITASAGDTTVIDSLGLANGNYVACGIQLDNQKSPEVSNTIIRNVIANTATVYGIYLNNTATTADYGNAIIKNNRIYNVTANSNATGTTNTGAFGIRVDVSPNATATVFNNVIYGLNKRNPTSANSNPFIRGINHCVAGNGNASYFNNTVLVNSDSSLNASSTAFWKGGTGAATVVRNNVFVNTTGAQTGDARHYAIYMYDTYPNSINTVSSNNLFWSANNNGYIGYAGGMSGYPGSPKQSLSDWQTATGEDKYSISYLPALDKANHLSPDLSDSSVWALNGRGIHLDSTIISTDINGNPRPLTRATGVPDIGAYEFTPTVEPPLTTAIGTLAADSTQIFLFGGDTVASIKWNTGSLPIKVEVRQYTGVQPLGTSENDKFMYFYTDVKDSGAGNYNYNIIVYYKDAWLGKITAPHDLKLQKRITVSNWLFNSGGAYSHVDTVRNIITDSSLSSFGALTGAELANPLPVQLLSLKAGALKSDVLLTWSTASEVNASHFVVERLVNGNQWSVIGKVKAKGNSSSINNYQFTDQSPLTPEASGHQSLYYRLRIVDNDGSYEYSKVVSVSREQQAAQLLSVYPNPFSNNVNVEFISVNEGIADISIVDITGRDVQLNISKQIVKGNNVLSINTDKLNNGIYFLSLELNGERQIVKLIKQ